MTPLDAALAYVMLGWLVFPCQWHGPRRKRPLTDHGFLDASADPVAITAWWRRWPNALIGIATGRATGFVVLDIDVKYADRYGFDTLDALGFAILPKTPMAHTASGGLHLYFAPPDGVEVACTEGERGSGIGHGLDWRGAGGFVIVPSPGSGYFWDPHWNFDTVALAPVPGALFPREPERPAAAARPVRPTTGLSPYAEAALDCACRRIIAAPSGEQEVTLNAECFSIGTLAGADAIPEDFSRRALLSAARQVTDYDRRRPWRARELENKVARSFDAGMRRPREARRA
jgi:Bifunctional DNA primase/polymerase, N-terminal